MQREGAEAMSMFNPQHAFEWTSAILVVAATLIPAAMRSRRTLRERQVEAVRWDSTYRHADESWICRAESLYF